MHFQLGGALHSTSLLRIFLPTLVSPVTARKKEYIQSIFLFIIGGDHEGKRDSNGRISGTYRQSARKSSRKRP